MFAKWLNSAVGMVDRASEASFPTLPCHRVCLLSLVQHARYLSCRTRVFLLSRKKSSGLSYRLESLRSCPFLNRRWIALHLDDTTNCRLTKAAASEMSSDNEVRDVRRQKVAEWRAAVGQHIFPEQNSVEDVGDTKAPEDADAGPSSDNEDDIPDQPSDPPQKENTEKNDGLEVDTDTDKQAGDAEDATPQKAVEDVGDIKAPEDGDAGPSSDNENDLPEQPSDPPPKENTEKNDGLEVDTDTDKQASDAEDATPQKAESPIRDSATLVASTSRASSARKEQKPSNDNVTEDQPSVAPENKNEESEEKAEKLHEESESPREESKPETDVQPQTQAVDDGDNSESNPVEPPAKPAEKDETEVSTTTGATNDEPSPSPEHADKADQSEQPQTAQPPAETDTKTEQQDAVAQDGKDGDNRRVVSVTDLLKTEFIASLSPNPVFVVIGDTAGSTHARHRQVSSTMKGGVTKAAVHVGAFVIDATEEPFRAGTLKGLAHKMRGGDDSDPAIVKLTIKEGPSNSSEHSLERDPRVVEAANAMEFKENLVTIVKHMTESPPEKPCEVIILFYGNPQTGKGKKRKWQSTSTTVAVLQALQESNFGRELPFVDMRQQAERTGVCHVAGSFIVTR